VTTKVPSRRTQSKCRRSKCPRAPSYDRHRVSATTCDTNFKYRVAIAMQRRRYGIAIVVYLLLVPFNTVNATRRQCNSKGNSLTSWHRTNQVKSDPFLSLENIPVHNDDKRLYNSNKATTGTIPKQPQSATITKIKNSAFSYFPSNSGRACRFYCWDLPSALLFYWCQHLQRDCVYEGRGGRKVCSMYSIKACITVADVLKLHNFLL
jgi:hypothetical protein